MGERRQSVAFMPNDFERIDHPPRCGILSRHLIYIIMTPVEL